ncbi:MAG: sigma-70 family RNA polymerase sigma factor [Chloroflexi bacterium]|nr:sigma-70 family RNA polymerase sigma factor [Chloroflexota bacterium]
MPGPPLVSEPLGTPAAFEALVQEIRPELHQYCARMIGSIIDAEDVVQEALAKAYTALPTTAVANLRGWLFRIVHNKAIDHLRRAHRQQNHWQPMEQLDEDALFVEPDSPLEEQELVAVALAVFLQLAPKQRSCVILKDVLGYSLAEISELLDATVPDIKSNLHRGRTRLRELSSAVTDDAPTVLGQQERALLTQYIDRFNARDFDAVRAMLAQEVRLDLFNRTTRRGLAEVGEYFHRYAQQDDWQLALGTVEQRPAILVYDSHKAASPPVYFMLLAWKNAQVNYIRDYRYTPYVMRNIQLEEEKQ